MSLACTHFQVLVGMRGIADVPELQRCFYSSVDLFSVLLAYSTSRRHTYLVLVHFLVHSTAVMHLLGVREIHFYREVYRLAENHASSTTLITAIYAVFIAEDIALHILNSADVVRDVAWGMPQIETDVNRRRVRGRACQNLESMVLPPGGEILGGHHEMAFSDEMRSRPGALGFVQRPNPKNLGRIGDDVSAC